MKSILEFYLEVNDDVCEACVGVTVDNVTFLSLKIFLCAGDRLAQKHSPYVES